MSSSGAQRCASSVACLKAACLVGCRARKHTERVEAAVLGEADGQHEVVPGQTKEPLDLRLGGMAEVALHEFDEAKDGFPGDIPCQIFFEE